MFAWNPAAIRPGRTAGGVPALILLGLLLPAVVASAQEASGGISSRLRLLDNLKAKAYSGKPIDFFAINSSLRSVIAELEKIGGFRLDMDPAIDGRVTYRIPNIPWDEALATVLADNALRIDIDLNGEGFKIFRGDPVTLTFGKSGRAKFFMFLYAHFFRIAAGIVLLAAVIVGWLLYRKRRARLRPTPQKALLSADAAESIKKKLLYLLESEKLYRDENLSLQTLADKLGISSHQLSWVINEGLQQSFVSLVNGYRIEEVKGRLSDPSFDHSSILQAALDAGFNTKSSFNRSFKKITGLTPSEYKKTVAR
jgi:AraC-like DNA-binding protein